MRKRRRARRNDIVAWLPVAHHSVMGLEGEAEFKTMLAEIEMALS